MKQFRDIGSLSFLSFAGIVTSLCYTIAVAIVFGVSRDVEIFFAASQVFMVFAALAQAGQLTEAFIPIFQKIKVEQSVEQAHRAAGVMFVWLLVFATIVATLVFIFSKAIVSVQVSGFSASDQLRVAELLLVFCPLVVVQVGLAFLKGVAQAEKIFLWPEWAGIAGSLISLAAVVFLYDMGAMALVIGLVSNVVLQFLVLSSGLLRNGFRFYLGMRSEFFSVREVFGKLLSTSFYALTAQVSAIAMTSALSNLPQGVLGAYNYAMRIFSKVGSVILRPITIIFFSHYSEAYARGGSELNLLADKALGFALAPIALSAVCCFAAGQYFLSAVFLGEKFPLEMIEVTYWFVVAYMLSFLASGFAQIARKVVVSIGHFNLLYFYLSLGRVLLAILTLWLIAEWAIPGVSIIILLNTLITAAVAGIVLYVKKRELFRFYRYGMLVKWLLVCVLALSCNYYLMSVVTLPVLGASVLTDLLGGTLRAAVTAFVTILLAWLINIEEVRVAVSWLASRIEKRTSQ